ncbi:MAG TPA: hypothetical protein VGU43_02965 [Thermoplasmata archaeon]|nr:hypothetical protein [Thermoplasmata archaeon]
MLAFADSRAPAVEEERFARCMFCGKSLVLLLNDRRGSACFDCLSLLGPEAIACPECGAEIAPPQRVAGCPQCSWSPLRT